MPNTVIALKKSATPSATPTSLANGELAINFADGKLYYKNVSGSIVEFNPTTSSNYFGTVNANSTLLVADTTNDVLTILPGTNITVVGDAVNDRLTIGLANDLVIPSSGSFRVAAVGGDEGGEIKLANAVTNSVLSGDIVIDINQNRLRFFESTGTNRGAFINLAAAAAGVGTDLLAGGSAVDTVARDQANTARTHANNAFNQANLAFSQANTTVVRSNTLVSTGTPLAWNSNTFDIYAITALANSITISADSGVPSNGQRITFRIQDDGTSRTITFTGGSSKSFEPIGVSLTASGSNWTYATTANRKTYFGCIYNASDDRWDIVAISQEV